LIEIRTSRRGAEPTTQQFDSQRIRLGRNPDNDVVLSSQACSRYHAEVVRDQGIYKIVDLGSANGVVHRGQRVKELPITDGLTVDLSDTAVTFTLEGADTGSTLMFGSDQTLVGSAPSVAAAAAVAAPPTAAPPPPAPAPAAAPRELYLQYDSGKTQRHLKVVSGAEYVIGRASDADVVLDDKEASTRHARIFSRGQDFFIKDLGSSNGTAVNGQRVDESPIDAEDEIQIGRTVIDVRGSKVGADDAAILAQTRIGASPFAKKAKPAAAPVATAPAPTPAEAGPVAVAARRPAEAPLMEDPAPGPGKPRPVLLLVAGLALAVVAVGGALLVVTMRRGGGPTPAPAASAAAAAVRVEVAPVVSKEMVFQVTASGSIKPKETATVSSEVAARVLDVRVREGQAVSKGTALARLNDRDLRLQIEEAQSAITKEQVDLAKDQYERNQRLFGQGAVTKQQLDLAKNAYLNLDSAYQTAAAKIRQLREQISKTQIVAPISGVVARKFVNAGELLAPGAPVVVLENTEEVLVDVDVSDRDVVKLHPGMDVEATTDAYPGRSFKGVVDRVGSTANPVSRSFTVQARIANPKQELRSGMIASLRVVMSKRRALLVPQEGVTGEGEAAKVFVVSGGVARRRPVSLGDRVDREVEVLSGLSEGDEVVVYGGERLADGQTVQGYRKP
jgi:membrane fusion protein, multidrug efflux system